MLNADRKILVYDTRVNWPPKGVLGDQDCIVVEEFDLALGVFNANKIQCAFLRDRLDDFGYRKKDDFLASQLGMYEPALYLAMVAIAYQVPLIVILESDDINQPKFLGPIVQWRPETRLRNSTLISVHCPEIAKVKCPYCLGESKSCWCCKGTGSCESLDWEGLNRFLGQKFGKVDARLLK